MAVLLFLWEVLCCLYALLIWIPLNWIVTKVNGKGLPHTEEQHVKDTGQRPQGW